MMALFSVKEFSNLVRGRGELNMQKDTMKLLCAEKKGWSRKTTGEELRLHVFVKKKPLTVQKNTLLLLSFPLATLDAKKMLVDFSVKRLIAYLNKLD